VPSHLRLRARAAPIDRVSFGWAGFATADAAQAVLAAARERPVEIGGRVVYVV
jgi:hypothetical protein